MADADVAVGTGAGAGAPDPWNVNQLMFTKSHGWVALIKTKISCVPPGDGCTSVLVTHDCQPPVAVIGIVAIRAP